MSKEGAVAAALMIVFFAFMARGLASEDHDRCASLFRRARSHSDTLVVATGGSCTVYLP